MSHFLRLLGESDKATSLADACSNWRHGIVDSRHFFVSQNSFDSIPGKPFAYWVSEALRCSFESLGSMVEMEAETKCGLGTLDDFRFLRLSWESSSSKWIEFAKGGEFSQWYSDIYLLLSWAADGKELKRFVQDKVGSASRKIQAQDYYFRPGLTWPRRTQGGLGFRAMPIGCIFADKGPAAFIAGDAPVRLLELLALINSKAFRLLVSLQVAFGSYEVGVIQRTPIPSIDAIRRQRLATLACRAWSLKRSLDTANETSHAFALPALLRPQLSAFDPPAIDAELTRIQAEIDDTAFDLYGFSDDDRAAAIQAPGSESTDSVEDATDDVDDEAEADAPAASADTLLSWAVGVAFGRFDWRLVTGERAAPAEPEPFDPLPALSPGMLPAGAAPFHAHGGILVDDPGHAHDLARLVDDVLVRVNQPVSDDLRRWLQREFFAFHLQRYSKSRRKVPIYWPLATASGSFTLWLYYPSLSSQTLYTAINDFLDGPNGKLSLVSGDVAALRNKGTARTRDEERRFESLGAFEQELIELRDTLLRIAPTFKPDQDDGVQVTAAPLWPLFRHKPWQKVLKDTWAKLEKGDYDWAHLAMNYWPDRVREKCKTDKSLAIAHGLEHLHAEPEVKPKKTRGRKKAGGAE